MSFCAIFIAMLLERFFDCSHLRHWRWFASYQKMIAQKLMGQSAYAMLGATLAPFLILLFLLEFFLANTLFGFLKLFIAVIIILYCFGPRNLWADIFACLIDITNADAGALKEKLKVTFGVVPSNGPAAFHRELLANIFIQANRRVFASVFWFGVLGLFGVVLYRLIAQIVDDSGKDKMDPGVVNLARKLEGYMDWLAIRALTMLFALGGNFARVFSSWSANVTRGTEANENMLVECGMAAMNSAHGELPLDGTAEKEQIALLDRSFAIMLLILALLVFWIP